MTVVAIMVAEFLDLWMNVVSAHVEDQRIKTILDLGCGTGRFTEALAGAFRCGLSFPKPAQRVEA
jgi:2-polyprenyl-3-methyl-5-hydroxy-6-metoxy-1,4-benzoquinol methylase